MTANQKLAIEILGVLPRGYIIVVEEMNLPVEYRVGGIYENGKCIAMFRMN